MSQFFRIFATYLKRHLFILLTSLSVLAAQAMTQEDTDRMVDSAYNAAMAGHIEQAISINMDGLALVPDDSMSWKCEFYSCLLYCYHRLGDYGQALHYGELCLRYDEQQGNPQDLSASLGNLAGIYSSSGQQQIAEEYLRRAIDIELQLLRTEASYSPKSLAVRQAMLGEVLLAKSKDLPPDEAKHTLNEALQLTSQALQTDRDLGRRMQEGMRLAQLGHIYQALNEQDKARYYTQQALAIARETGNKTTEVLCLLQLEQYDQAVAIAHETGLRKQEYEAIDHLYQQAKAEGRYAIALNRLEQARALYTLLQNEESQRQLIIANVAYDTYRKEKELEDKNQQLAAQKARTKALIIFAFLAIAIVCLLIAVIILLRIRKQAIEQASQYRERQYSILAHDLTNPMVAQQQVQRMLYRDFDNHTPDEVRTVLGQLLASSDNQLALLRNLSEFTRLQQGKRTITPTRLDISSVAAEMVTVMKSIADLKHITLINRCEHLYVIADRDTLRTILRNFISNAIKFSAPNTTIEIGSLAPNQVYVHDSGCGIPPQQIDSILHASTRVEPTIGTNGESGTGIGLLLCRELIALNRGSLDIHSVPQQGTTMILTLPQAD